MKKRYLVAVIVAVFAVKACAGSGQEKEAVSHKPVFSENVPHRETAIGIADKNIDDIDVTLWKNVRHDTDNNTRIAWIHTATPITEYAISYYNKYFSDDTEIHVIINTHLNTTTRISNLGGVYLDVSTHEYVPGEEHSAKTLCSGEWYGSDIVWHDNGDIEHLDFSEYY